MEINEQNSSERTINDKWLENIYNILIRLETSDKLASEGCRDIIEYMQLSEYDLQQIRYKNYSIFLTDFLILINNCKKIIGDTKYKEFIKNIDTLRKLESDNKGFLVMKSNNITKTQQYYLRPLFYDAITIISKMRRDVISCLWNILSPSAQDADSELPR